MKLKLCKGMIETTGEQSLPPEPNMTGVEVFSIADFHRFLQPIIQREVDSVLEDERSAWKATTCEYEAKIASAVDAAREKDELGRSLDNALEQVTKLRAVPFPLALMRCNSCGKDLSDDDEAIYVADGCGAVS
jgi:hypothetical protein